MLTPIIAHHGGQHDDPRWFTTDRSHAAYFGEVRTYRLYPQTMLTIDTTHPALCDAEGRELIGYEADEALYALLETTGVDAIAVSGWEGDGLCILIAATTEYECIAE